MTDQTQRKAITPQEAEDVWIAWSSSPLAEKEGRQLPRREVTFPYSSLLYTVATEPERTRAAVVKALRDLHWSVASTRADAIENGEPL